MGSSKVVKTIAPADVLIDLQSIRMDHLPIVAISKKASLPGNGSNWSLFYTLMKHTCFSVF